MQRFRSDWGGLFAGIVGGASIRWRGSFRRSAVAGDQLIGGAANNDDSTSYLTTSNDLSWTRGAAMFRFGGEHRVYRNNSVQLAPPKNPNLTFNSRWTNGPLDNAASSPMGQGWPLSCSVFRPRVGQPERFLRRSVDELCLVLPVRLAVQAHLTFNAGVRYDFDSPMTERFNRSVRNFDFTTANPHRSASDRRLCEESHCGDSGHAIPGQWGSDFCGRGGQPRQIWEASHTEPCAAHRAGLAGAAGHGGANRLWDLIYTAGSGQEKREPEPALPRPRH